MLLPERFIQAVREQTDLVELIRAYLPSLKKTGANYKAPCPFHQEKTPSFMVHPQKQYYHCFGCGAHGDAIRFVQEYLKLSFVEAIQFLAEQNGLPLPEMVPEETQQQTDPNALSREQYVTFLNAVSLFYRKQLKGKQTAIDYLKSRQLTGQTAYFFGIGYAPDGWQNLLPLFPENHTYSDYEALLLQSGLVIKNDTGKIYDRFRHRIMFPIHNVRGEIIAFGGRIFEATTNKADPKYLNSPETAFFTKSKTLYGLYLQQKEIRQAQRVLVVEGYMDVVMLHQAGIRYSVATLGTATTAEHIQLLFRTTERIIFCFDGDAAGKRAAWKALENSIEAFVDGNLIEFLFLPDGEDPDSFVRTVGKEGFEQYLYNSYALSQFLLEKLQEGLVLSIEEERLRLLQRAEPLLRKISLKKAAGLSLLLRQRLAALSQISLVELEQILNLTPQASQMDATTMVAAPVSMVSSRYYQQMQLLVLRLFGMLYYFPHFLAYLTVQMQEDLQEILKKQTQPSDYSLLLTLIEYIQNDSTTLDVNALHAFFEQHPIYKNRVEKIQEKMQSYLHLWQAFPVEKLQQEFHHTVTAFWEFMRKQDQIKNIQQRLST